MHLQRLQKPSQENENNSVMPLTGMLQREQSGPVERRCCNHGAGPEALMRSSFGGQWDQVYQKGTCVLTCYLRGYRELGAQFMSCNIIKPFRFVFILKQ